MEFLPLSSVSFQHKQCIKIYLKDSFSFSPMKLKNNTHKTINIIDNNSPSIEFELRLFFSFVLLFQHTHTVSPHHTLTDTTIPSLNLSALNFYWMK